MSERARFWGTLAVITAALVVVAIAVTVSLAPVRRAEVASTAKEVPSAAREAYSVMVSVAERAEDTVALCGERAKKADVTQSGVVETRPEFGLGNQVLSPEEIRAGETYVLCNMETGDSSVYTVTSEPHARGDDDGRLVVDVIHWYRESTYVERLYLSDAGVVPCRGGWHPVNVLLRLMSPR